MRPQTQTQKSIDLFCVCAEALRDAACNDTGMDGSVCVSVNGPMGVVEVARKLST